MMNIFKKLFRKKTTGVPTMQNIPEPPPPLKKFFLLSELTHGEVYRCRLTGKRILVSISDNDVGAFKVVNGELEYTVIYDGQLTNNRYTIFNDI